MTVEHVTSNVHEATARAVKASKLADVLVAHGATAAEAEALPPSGRRMAERLAGVNKGSSATWAVVVAMLEWRVRWGADPVADAERHLAQVDFASDPFNEAFDPPAVAS